MRSLNACLVVSKLLREPHQAKLSSFSILESTQRHPSGLSKMLSKKLCKSTQLKSARFCSTGSTSPQVGFQRYFRRSCESPHRSSQQDSVEMAQCQLNVTPSGLSFKGTFEEAVQVHSAQVSKILFSSAHGYARVHTCKNTHIYIYIM